MATKKIQVYKYDKETDAAVKATKQVVFDTEGTPVVMAGTFRERRDAQIKRRKAQGY